MSDKALIDEINNIEGLVTTSSCSGRISVFLEGQKGDNGAIGSRGSVGGKGGGGNWLFVSHNPVDINEEPYASGLLQFFGFIPFQGGIHLTQESRRYVHLKFEAMVGHGPRHVSAATVILIRVIQILHVLAGSIQDAQRVLNGALAAGFRESGAVGLLPTKSGSTNPIVAVRSNGLGLDAIIGFKGSDGVMYPMVDEDYLRTIFRVVNDKFTTNRARIERFRSSLVPKPDSWREDPVARRERKKMEGLKRQELLDAQNRSAGIRTQVEMHDTVPLDDPCPDFLGLDT